VEVRTFQGGAHIPHYKSFTEDKPITRMAVPKVVIVPLQQHLGAPNEPLVKVGDKVEVGQKIGDSKEHISAPIHASVTGTVVAIEPRPCYEGGEAMCIVIEAGEGNQEFEPKVKRNPADMSKEEIIAAIREAGIVGMGGAAFPTHANISQRNPVDSLLLNGAECEPFLTCDHRQMVERPDDLIAGAECMMRCIGAKTCYMGIEVNKPDAIEILSEKVKDREDIKIVPLAVKYPQGNKAHLINAITGRNVPRGARSSEIGCIVRNVGTTIAGYEAVVYGRPSYERVVTVTGPTVPKPGNYIVRIGTPVSHVVREAGVENLEDMKVVIGGPMTGMAQTNLDAPVVKCNTGVLILPREMVREDVEYGDCVRCGKCVEQCPVFLYPNEISISAEHDMISKAESWDVMDCIECGICAYVCPSSRPIVKFIKQVKPVIKKLQRSRK
jgi:Na+-translocating ferredoxin:NAD+ oxidoreductase subunit C